MPEAQDGFRVVRQVCRKAPTPWRVGVFSHSKSSSKIGHCTAETTKCAPCAMSGLSHAPSTSLTSLTALSTSLGCCFQRFRQLCEGGFKLVKEEEESMGKATLGTCTTHYEDARDPRASSQRRGGSALAHTSAPSGCEPHQALSVLLGHLHAVVCYFQGGTDLLDDYRADQLLSWP